MKLRGSAPQNRVRPSGPSDPSHSSCSYTQSLRKEGLLRHLLRNIKHATCFKVSFRNDTAKRTDEPLHVSTVPRGALAPALSARYIGSCNPGCNPSAERDDPTCTNLRALSIDFSSAR